MSGGKFDYDQYRIGQIADIIDDYIINNGSDERNEWGDLRFPEIPKDIINEFKVAVNLLRRAQVYAHRIDWLLSNDDGPDSFRRRLVDDLRELRPYMITLDDFAKPDIWRG